MGQGHSSTVPAGFVEKPNCTHVASTGIFHAHFRLRRLFAVPPSGSLTRPVCTAGPLSALGTRAAKRQSRRERRLRGLGDLPAKPDVLVTCSPPYDGSSPLQWDTGNPGSSARVRLKKLGARSARSHQHSKLIAGFWILLQRHKRQRSNVCTWSTLEAVDYSVSQLLYQSPGYSHQHNEIKETS